MGRYEIGSPKVDQRQEVEKLVHLFTKEAKRTANGHSSKVVSSIRLVKIEITQSGEKTKVIVLQSWLTLCDPWTVVCQASLSMEFSRKEYWRAFSSVQFSPVAQSCLTLCDPMNRSTPSLPVHHHLPEFTQTHVHRVSDAIQPSHPLSSPSPPAPNPSQHHSLFQLVSSSHEVAKVLEFQL